MVSNSPDSALPQSPKPLKGVGIIIAEEHHDGSHQTLGVIFAPTTERLKKLILSIHSQKITVNLADIKGGVITLEM